MNYRHIFHAGNFGDVLKHVLLVSLVRAMRRKEKGFLFLDTHAGIGAYDLSSSRADRTAEYLDGIGRLWDRSDLRGPLAEYVRVVREFNDAAGGPGEMVRYYPGSPAIVAALLRPQDRMALSELHPDDFVTLKENMHRYRRVSAQCIDAYSALKAYLPPAERRGLILIDPPYEDPNETSRLRDGLANALQRFPGGVYAIWYPIKDRAGAEAFRASMASLPLPATVAAELTIGDDAPGRDRLCGSGMLILNPPWRIEDELTETLGALGPILAQETGARAGLKWLRERV